MISQDPFLCVIDGLLSKEECKGLISTAEYLQTDDMGNKSWHKPNTGGLYQRVIMVDPELARLLYCRIKSLLP